MLAVCQPIGLEFPDENRDAECDDRPHLFSADGVGAIGAELRRNSPERRGEIGCRLVENKPLPPGLKAPLVWATSIGSQPRRARGLRLVRPALPSLRTVSRDVMNKGDTLVIPAGIAMRLVATGPTPRRALAVIVYDASQPPTTRMEGEATPKSISCK